MEKNKVPFVGLVNNAGISGRTPFESVDLARGRKMFETNYFGAIALTQKYLPTIRKHQSRILFISSLMGILCNEGGTMYGGSKHATEAAVDALRMEMLDFNVSVSDIVPGFIKTEIGESAIRNSEQGSEEQRQVYKKFWDGYAEGRRANFVAADGPEVSSVAIVHALTDKYPKTRYYVANAQKFHASVVAVLVGILPDRLKDLLLKK